jgi:DNA gyrase subunit A
MIINRSGITIRMEVAQLRIMGRATQGVRLINLKDSDTIASVAKVESDGTADNQQVENDGEEGAENEESAIIDPNDAE